MNFEWDDVKRQSNIAKHLIDFVDAQTVFDGRPAVTAPSSHPEEPRFVTTAELHGRLFSVIWTWRGNTIRIISARRARDAEERAYRSIHGG